MPACSSRKMNASPADVAASIAHLCDLFLHEDLDARGWAFLYPDESEWESPDCDVMSERFLRLARREGYDGHLIRADSVDEGRHWFTVITFPGRVGGVAVDWTARQFHNAGHPAPPIDPLRIACPLVFTWPGRYPLSTVSFEDHAAEPTISQP